MSHTIKTQKSLCPVLGSIKKSPCPVPQNTGPVLPINNEQSLSVIKVLYKTKWIYQTLKQFTIHDHLKVHWDHD